MELKNDSKQNRREIDPRDITPTDYVDAYAVYAAAKKHDLSPESVLVALRRDLAARAARADDLAEQRPVLDRRADSIVVHAREDVIYHTPLAVLDAYRAETDRWPLGGYPVVVPCDDSERECEYQATFETARERRDRRRGPPAAEEDIDDPGLDCLGNTAERYYMVESPYLPDDEDIGGEDGGLGLDIVSTEESE